MNPPIQPKKSPAVETAGLLKEIRWLGD